jgi:hypothetical protein
MKRSFEPLSEAEEAWLQSRLRQGSDFVQRFDPMPTESALTLKSLDRAFANRIGSDSPDPAFTPNEVVLCVGVAFGNHLVKHLGFQWVIVTDQFGTDIGVLARPGKGDVVIVPTDFIAKRYESRETDFMERSFAVIESQIREIAAKWGEGG